MLSVSFLLLHLGCQCCLSHFYLYIKIVNAAFSFLLLHQYCQNCFSHFYFYANIVNTVFLIFTFTLKGQCLKNFVLTETVGV